MCIIEPFCQRFIAMGSLVCKRFKVCVNCSRLDYPDFDFTLFHYGIQVNQRVVLTFCWIVPGFRRHLLKIPGWKNTIWSRGSLKQETAQSLGQSPYSPDNLPSPETILCAQGFSTEITFIDFESSSLQSL